MANKIEKSVEEIMISVFELGDSQYMVEDLSPDNIKTWDSIRHIQLVISLEEEFNISLSDDEINNMSNYKSIVCLLSDKLEL